MEDENRNAEIIYKKVGRIWCPALNDFVTFNRSGFQHLLRKHGRHRTKNEKVRRLALLSFAERIVRNPNIKAAHKKKSSLSRLNQHGEKIRATRNAEFWKLSEEMNGKTIYVIVRKIGDGEKHFFSIYDN